MYFGLHFLEWGRKTFVKMNMIHILEEVVHKWLHSLKGEGSRILWRQYQSLNTKKWIFGEECQKLLIIAWRLLRTTPNTQVINRLKVLSSFFVSVSELFILLRRNTCFLSNPPDFNILSLKTIYFVLLSQ